MGLLFIELSGILGRAVDCRRGGGGVGEMMISFSLCRRYFRKRRG